LFGGAVNHLVFYRAFADSEAIHEQDLLSIGLAAWFLIKLVLVGWQSVD
jgi:hypothetical protein